MIYYQIALGISLCIIVGIGVAFAVLLSKYREGNRRLEQIEAVLEYKQLKYENVEINSEKIEKISHEFNNQLASVTYLVEDGETQVAMDILRNMEKTLRGLTNETTSKRT